MELLKLSSKKIKNGMIGILIILILGNNSPVYAVYYHFEEDFLGGPDEDWKFSAWFYQPSGSYEEATHTFTFDGELVSNGEPNGAIVNNARKNDTTAFGAWSFDVFIPNNPLTEVHDITFSMAWFSIRPASYSGEPGTTSWPEFNLDGIGNGIIVEAWNRTKDPSSPRLKFEEVTSGVKFDVYQHFDVIRTSASFYVYLDGELIIDTDFSSDWGPEINYFDLIAAQGSGVKYDNIKITTDAQGVLDSLLPTSDTDTSITSSEITEDTNSVSDSSSESTNDSLFFAVGTGSIALLSTVSYWRISKKKI